MLNTDEKIEKKSTGTAGQEQRLEDMWNTDGEDGKEGYRESRTGGRDWKICGKRMRRWKGRVQGEQDKSRDWKICMLNTDEKNERKSTGEQDRSRD